MILVENVHYNKLDDYIASVSEIISKDRVQVIRAFTPAGTLRMLKHKRGDVVIDWQARLIYNLTSGGLQYDDVEFHDATKLVPTKNVHLAFSPNQPEKFRTFINTRIEALSQSRQLSTLVKNITTQLRLQFFSWVDVMIRLFSCSSYETKILIKVTVH